MTLHHSVKSGMVFRDEGRGTPILLIHGWGVSGALFDAQFEALADRHRVIAPDLRGHGDSDPFTASMPFAHLADDIALLMGELDLDRACVVGWSMGAMVAWDLLLRYPGLNVAGLITLDMVPQLLNGPEWQHGLRDGEDIRVFNRQIRQMREDWPGFAEWFVPRMFAERPDGPDKAVLQQALEIALANDNESLALIWTRMAEQDFRASLASIEQPTLIIAGARSQLYGVRAGQWIATSMPNARLEIFSESGHAPHIEEPQRFNKLLSEFAGSLHRNPDRTAEQPAETGPAS